MAPEASKRVLAYTPMFHARMFKETATFRNLHFQPTRTGLASMTTYNAGARDSESYLDGNPDFDRPLTVQFCANEPSELLEAAKYVQPYCDAVDLNLGCPQGIARSGHYGAFLQENWDLIYRLINTLHKELDVPVTAKIRILETREKTLEYARMIISAGASILTVHGRQRDQKGHKTGLADWSVMRYLRDNLPPDTVIFANGNILRHDDIDICLEKTGADGVMSAEGNLHDPSIFTEGPAIGSEGREYWRGRDGKGGYRMDAVFRRYMDILYKYVLEIPPPQRKPLFLVSDLIPVDETPENYSEDTSRQPSAKRQKRDNGSVKTISPNLLAMQAHLFRLLRPLVSQHTDIRDALARCRAGDMSAFENVLRLVESVTKEGLRDYDAHPEKYEEHTKDVSYDEIEGADMGLVNHESSLAAINSCKRPWWVCQAYVRPLPNEALAKGSLTLSKKDKMKNGKDVTDIKTNVNVPQDLSQREKLDVRDGMEKSDVVAQAIVCG